MRRSSVSIPSNIAEGQARYSQKEFLRFLSTARGSLAELQTQLEVARNLGYVTQDQANSFNEKTTTIYKLINSLYAAIDRRVRASEACSNN